jgi:multidrug efflux system outer membrane protein
MLTTTIFRYGAGICGMIGLSACVGEAVPVPPRATVPSPVAWRGGGGNAGATIDARWWQAFGDPVLSDLVVRALARNDDVSVAAARVEEARALFRLAQAQRQPNVSGSMAGGPQRTVSGFGSGTDQLAGQVQISASYDLDLFGRLANASAAARASLLATEAAGEGVRLAVAASTASGYLTLRALDARLAVLRQTLAARSESLHLAQRRAETGYSPRLELSQAQADYRATEQLIPAAELAITRQEDGLRVLLGEAPGDIARGRLLRDLAPPPIALSLPSALIRRRPDIAQAEQQVVAADRQLDAARAAFLPNVQLTGSGGLVASTALANPITIFSIGGSVLAPIFDAGRLRAQQDTQAARRDQAAYAYRRTVLNAFREVEDGIAEQRRLAEQEGSVLAQRDALTEALRLATNRYRAGYSSFLEQLDAQRGLLAAELTVLQVRTERLTSAVRLFQALGGGWSGGTGGQ